MQMQSTVCFVLHKFMHQVTKLTMGVGWGGTQREGSERSLSNEGKEMVREIGTRELFQMAGAAQHRAQREW